MSAERATYLDSSAVVKLVMGEPESVALRHYLKSRRPLVSSALARTEVGRALLPYGERVVRRGAEVLMRMELVRVNLRVLTTAASLLPHTLLSLDAIHLATCHQLGDDLDRLVTYDVRMAAAAREYGWTVVAPS